MHPLTPEQIHDWQPFFLEQDGLTPMQRARQRAERAGQWHDRQYMGRRWAIGCVALEITQRCNLDCTLCYLSESSEALKDLPLPEIFRRIDLIHAHYGPDTDVQVTGGDPTLRKLDDIARIVAYIRDKGMRSSLFTNGILAKRDMLQRLAAEGLNDVAFHVDMTQERKGYDSEIALNAIREDCIAQARGLKLQIFFNTTVFDGNFEQIPDVVRFFVRHADSVKLASFQLQADTGRGLLRERGVAINSDSVEAQILQGIGAPMSFDTGTVGHHDCNRAAFALVANGRVHDLLGNRDYARALLTMTSHVAFDRARKLRTGVMLLAAGLRRPILLAKSLQHFSALAWRMKKDVLLSRGKASKLGFFIHNFMDAEHLDCDRLNACSFMVMTAEGPLSMCLHNAKRDDYLLQPIKLDDVNGEHWWNPVNGQTTADAPTDAAIAVQLTRKNARGRARRQLSEDSKDSKRIAIEVM